MVGARGADPWSGAPLPRPVCRGLEQGLLSEVRDGTAWPGRVNRGPCGEEAAQGRLSGVQMPLGGVRNRGSGGAELPEEGF